jgi:toxin ParE1/3/4
MTFDLLIDDLAKQDLRETVDWYNQKRSGLGKEFFEDYKKTIVHIASNPLLFRERFRKTRKVQVGSRFPYFISFKVDVDRQAIIVIAVLFGGRNPQLLDTRSDT